MRASEYKPTNPPPPPPPSVNLWELIETHHPPPPPPPTPPSVNLWELIETHHPLKSHVTVNGGELHVHQLLGVKGAMPISGYAGVERWRSGDWLGDQVTGDTRIVITSIPCGVDCGSSSPPPPPPPPPLTISESKQAVLRKQVCMTEISQLSIKLL